MSDTPEFLKNSLKFGINLGLTRMQALCDILGNPEKELKCIHIAGTNGKGSTVMYISSVLAAAGYNVGIYTSPYLERFEERIRIIDGKDGLMSYVEDDSYGEITVEVLNAITEEVKAATSVMLERGYEHPTEFELVTAIAFLWFKRQKCDVVVLETGLGGRYDSTNVIEKPLCTAICTIGMDHTDRLGDTIAKITSEKAGIFKQGVAAVVTDPEDMILDNNERKDVLSVFVSEAEKIGCKLKIASVGQRGIEYTDDGKMSFFADALGKDHFVTTLLGEHQITNCVLAVSVIRTLAEENKISVTGEQIEEGISLTRWKGRVEIVNSDPLVIMDGGHNPQGATSLFSVLEKLNIENLKGSPVRLVFGGMADKDLKRVISVIHDSEICINEILCTRVNNPRSMSGNDLCKEFNLVYNNEVKALAYEDACEAVKDAVNASFKDKKPLIITGSLYLLGQIRGQVLNLIKEKA